MKRFKEAFADLRVEDSLTRELAAWFLLIGAGIPKKWIRLGYGALQARVLEGNGNSDPDFVVDVPEGNGTAFGVEVTGVKPYGPFLNGFPTYRILGKKVERSRELGYPVVFLHFVSRGVKVDRADWILSSKVFELIEKGLAPLIPQPNRRLGIIEGMRDIPSRFWMPGDELHNVLGGLSVD